MVAAHDASNASGHLLLHLAGNVRQWIVGGVGGRPVDRRRDLEFAPVDQPEAADLLTGLARAVDESDAVLAALDPAALESRVTIQGVDVTRMGAIYHVVEHFAMHTGQILWIAKARIGASLGSTPSQKARLAPPGPAPTRARRPDLKRVGESRMTPGSVADLVDEERHAESRMIPENKANPAC